MMTKRLSLGGIFLSTLAIAVAYAAAFLPGGAPPWAEWTVAVATGVVMVATMALGAEKGGRIGWLVLPFGFTLLVIAGGFSWVLALPPVDPADPALWLGLPPRAAVVIYGIGILPFFVIPTAYAASFERQTLTEGDLERVRRAAREFRAQGEAGAHAGPGAGSGPDGPAGSRGADGSTESPAGSAAAAYDRDPGRDRGMDGDVVPTAAAKAVPASEEVA